MSCVTADELGSLQRWAFLPSAKGVVPVAIGLHTVKFVSEVIRARVPETTTACVFPFVFVWEIQYRLATKR